MNDQRLQSLYSRLQAQRADMADAALANRIGNALADDAQRLSDGLARSAPVRRATPRRVVGWALAASVALVAVFAGRQLGNEQPVAVPVDTDARDMIAQGPAPEPLFSGSFEREQGHASESIFDNDFGS